MGNPSSLRSSNNLQHLEKKPDAVTATTTNFLTALSIPSTESTELSLSPTIMKDLTLPEQLGRNNMFRRLTRTLSYFLKTAEQMLTCAI